MITQSDLARVTDIPLPTICKMIQRGALPPPDVAIGRLRVYSDQLQADLTLWFRTKYVRQQRGLKYQARK